MIETSKLLFLSEPRQGEADDLPLPLIQKLCAALDERAISYCQWKSNWKLDLWARGEGDLDLLIARPDAQAFAAILGELGFKQAEPPPSQQMPGLLNYYGFDAEAQKFVHVQAHYQLILGHDLTKNYRLPIEQAYLASVIRRDSFLVPAPEFELIVFVLRMVLKYSVLDSIQQAFARKRAASSAAVQSELRYLENLADGNKVCEALDQHFPSIDFAFFNECKRSLRLDCPAHTRLRIRMRLQRRLRPEARRSQIADGLLKIKRRLAKAARLTLFIKRPRKRFLNGGSFIAVVGGDGAGKSTSVEEIHRWLSKRFDARRIHIGKPPSSLTTLAVAAFSKASRLIRSLFGSNRPRSAKPGLLQLLGWACTARDRYRLYVKARRFAANGGIVICDRYPLPEIQLMDGPKIALALDERPGRLARLLQKTEEKFYRRILPPDLLTVLRVNPEIAVRRKTNEDASHVRWRSQEVWEASWGNPRVRVVDASQPVDDVLAELKSIVWSRL